MLRAASGLKPAFRKIGDTVPENTALAERALRQAHSRRIQRMPKALQIGGL